MKCFAGCPQHAVVQALGLRYADLFVPGVEPVAPTIIAVYDYCDLAGTIVARKTRTSLKTFRWCTPAGDGWRPGLHGAAPSLYRLPDLVGQRLVVKVEGEKAVDRLWSLKVPATCGPAGASQWLDPWSELLRHLGCRELVILPDADGPGRHHAEAVAASCYGRQTAPLSGDRPAPPLRAGLVVDRPVDAAAERMRVKVAALPGLPTGADVVDFLAAHSVADLLAVIQQAPYWYPGADVERRLEHRRALTRERMRRKRERDRATLVGDAVNVSDDRLVLGVTLRTSSDAVNVSGDACDAVTRCERSSYYVTKSGTEQSVLTERRAVREQREQQP
jgi:hypothetical protein